MGDIKRHFVFLTWSLATFYIPLVLSRKTTPECRILIHRDITLRLACVDVKGLGMKFRVPERQSTMTWPEAIALSTPSLAISADL